MSPGTGLAPSLIGFSVSGPRAIKESVASSMLTTLGQRLSL